MERNLEKGQDWRHRIKIEGRGMGSMESNEDNLVARRMKKQGLSWTIKGALRMHKTLQLVANKDLTPFCFRSVPPLKKERLTPLVRSKKGVKGYPKWVEGSVPALVGPHASRPLVRKLHALAYPSFPVN